MSLSRFVKAPAARVVLLPQQGPLATSQTAMSSQVTTARTAPRRDLARQSFGAVDQVRAYGGADAGAVTNRPFEYTWQDRVQVNPAHEQPKLIFNSGAQPLIRWGLARRFVRTFMSASPRFQGRWAYVGYIQRHYTERARLTGNPSRLGRTYVMRRPSTGPGPRAINLGGGS